MAQQVLAESHALQAGYQTLASTEREEEDAWALYGEWFGQAVGGLDQLRIKKMVPDTRGKEVSLWVRGVSGQTTAAWQAQLQGVQAFLVGSPAAADSAGARAASTATATVLRNLKRRWITGSLLGSE